MSDVFLSLHLNELTSGAMRQLEADFPVSAEQRRLLTFAAVLFTTNRESCRTFRLRVSKHSVINDMLGLWWEIADKAEALETVKRLSSANIHTPAADGIYRAITQTDAAQALSSPLYSRVRRLLLGLGYADRELRDIKTTAAWDYGRAGFVARYSVKAGYLEEAEAWDHMRIAADNAAKSYSNWREYLAGYIFGRALGYGADSTNLKPVLRYLLENENSPYKGVPFN